MFDAEVLYFRLCVFFVVAVCNCRQRGVSKGTMWGRSVSGTLEKHFCVSLLLLFANTDKEVSLRVLCGDVLFPLPVESTYAFLCCCCLQLQTKRRF